MTKKIDPKTISSKIGTLYPSPFNEPCLARERKSLGDEAGLSQFGVNLLRLPPNAWSSQRHWHTQEDEFIFVVAGEVTLETDSGEEILTAGECAGFKAGDENGHCLKNNSQNEVLVLEIGSRNPSDEAYYSDIDMKTDNGGHVLYTKKDGTPYAAMERKSAK